MRSKKTKLLSLAVLIVVILVAFLVFDNFLTYKISYNSASYQVDVSPEHDVMTADWLHDSEGFAVTTNAVITSGRIRYWGSSSFHVVELKLCDGENTLYELPRPYTEDYTLVRYGKGHKFFETHYFVPDEKLGYFPAGTYDAVLTAGGKEYVFKDAMTIECCHDYERLSSTSTTIKYLCRRCGNIEETTPCVDWWIPTKEDELRLVGNWISDDFAFLQFDHDAHGVMSNKVYPIEGNYYARGSGDDMYWYANGNKLYILEYRYRAIYMEDSLYTMYTYECQGDKLTLTSSDGKSKEYKRTFITAGVFD